MSAHCTRERLQMGSEIHQNWPLAKGKFNYKLVGGSHFETHSFGINLVYFRLRRPRALHSFTHTSPGLMLGFRLVSQKSTQLPGFSAPPSTGSIHLTTLGFRHVEVLTSDYTLSIPDTPWDCHICLYIDPQNHPNVGICRHIWHTWSVWESFALISVLSDGSPPLLLHVQVLLGSNFSMDDLRTVLMAAQQGATRCLGLNERRCPNESLTSKRLF